MKVKIYDYADASTEVEIGNLEDIAIMGIEVISGDELLHVTYKNYDTRVFDSSECRNIDCYDGGYTIYDFRKKKEDNLLFDEKWNSYSNSYMRMM